MLGRALRIIKSLLIGIFLLIVLLLLPSTYIEVFCRGEPLFAEYEPIIKDEKYQRSEANSFLTYPEWHIVYAYEGLAHVLETGDEYEFGYVSSVAGFWSSACALNRTSQEHGEADFVTRGVIHIIGISFTFELGMKALYEETIGRLFAIIRGPEKSPQDKYAAWMARDFSNFLQQVPWYEYDFDKSTTELWEKPITQGLRGWERRLALAGEWKAKSAYAAQIKTASDAAGPAALRIRLIVEGISPAYLSLIDSVEVIDSNTDYVKIEADRYRKLTKTLQQIVNGGGKVTEIAGNDDILVTAIRPSDVELAVLDKAKVIADIPRDGYEDNRVLINSKVENLALLFSELEEKRLKLEHVYDY